MGLIDKLFGGGDALASLRKAVRQSRWADALVIADDLLQGELSAELEQECRGLADEAGDQLAIINRDEYEACLRAGEVDKAAEHLALARRQVRSEELRQSLEESALNNTLTPPAVPKDIPPPVVSGSCASCSSHGGGHAEAPAETVDAADAFDREVRLELVLASYPADLTPRYSQIDGPFLEAFLLAHEGHSKDALILFEDVPPGQRDDLYHFERGSLLARIGNGEEALQDLNEAVELNPAHELALESLVQLQLGMGFADDARKRLHDSLDRGTCVGLSHSLLAAILLREGNVDDAFQHASQAWNSGRRDGETGQILAHLFERKGELQQAEALLQQLGSGGGCGGGINLPLAEFWLRQGSNLEKAQKQFGQALSQEPNNPRWLFRLGETFLRQGRRGEGERLLQEAMRHGDLEPGLRQAGESLLGH